MNLDAIPCEICDKPSVTWGVREGGRCHMHSTYTLPGDSKPWEAEYERRGCNPYTVSRKDVVYDCIVQNCR